jgi:hypothetical protein
VNKPPLKKDPRKAIGLLALPLVLAVLALVVYLRREDFQEKVGTNTDAAAPPQSTSTWGKAQEDALDILKKNDVSVIVEPLDLDHPEMKYASSVFFKGMPGKKRTFNDSVFRQLSALPDLKKVAASDTNFADGQLKYLAGLAKLASLDLSNTQVTDDGLAHIRSLTELVGLNLHDTAVSDRGLSNLCSLTNLSTLDLSKTKVTDAGLKTLQSLQGLHTLILSDTEIGDAGLEYLPTLPKLKRLILFDTQVTSKGVNKLHDTNPKVTIGYTRKRS